MSGSRVALVTGGGSGIGRATADALARDGWTVVVADRDHAAAETVAETIRAAGGRAEPADLDVADLDAGAALVGGLVDRYGAIEAVVCSAGISGRGAPFLTIDPAAFDAMMDVHLRGHFFLLQRLVPGMQRIGRGAIVLVSSMFALRGSPGMAHYTAAKGALLGLARALAVELGPSGIRVNAVAPGLIRTPMTEASLATGGGTALFESRAAAAPLRRLASADDVADTIAYLVSERAASLTGQTLSPSCGEVFT